MYTYYNRLHHTTECTSTSIVLRANNDQLLHATYAIYNYHAIGQECIKDEAVRSLH